MGVPVGRTLGEVWLESTKPGNCGGQLTRNCPCGGPSGYALGEVWPARSGRREKMEGREKI